MAETLSKAAKRHFRELAALAYRRELEAALRELDDRFAAWKRGELDPFDLNEEIHRHHNGISRDLYKKYGYNNPLLTAAYALKTGVLAESEVDEKHLPLLTKYLEFYASLDARDEGTEADEAE